jgi:putative ABC transport system ATP-binding protein
MIELYRVSKTVPSGGSILTILQPLDLIIPDGQFIAVVGPSGSGKSTLLALMAGLDSPTSGDIIIDGLSIVNMNEDALAELRGAKIGIVFQSFHLIPSLTAFENIIVPMELAGMKGAKKRTARLLGDVDLADRGHHYPSQLSGGEQQRVAIARAFANNPSILLADEPTGNLDTDNGRHVFDLMVEMNRKYNATLVLVTHDHELAAMADRRISLRGGQLVGDDSTRVCQQTVEASTS